MDEDLRAGLVAVCTGGRHGHMTRAEFTAAVKNVAAAAERLQSTKNVIKTIEVVIAAAEKDRDLDMRGAIFVVDSILSCCANAASGTEDSTENGAPAKQLADALKPHLEGWLNKLILHRRNSSSRNEAIIKRWDQWRVLSGKQVARLMLLLGEVQKDVASRKSLPSQEASQPLSQAYSQESPQTCSQEIPPPPLPPPASPPPECPVGSQEVSQALSQASSQPLSPGSSQKPAPDAIGEAPIGSGCTGDLNSSSLPSSSSTPPPAKRPRRNSKYEISANAPPSSPVIGSPGDRSACGSSPSSILKKDPGVVHSPAASTSARKEEPDSQTPPSSQTPPRTGHPTRLSLQRAPSRQALVEQARLDVTKFLNGGTVPRPDIWRVLGDCRCLFRAVCRACDDPLNKIERDVRGQPIIDGPRRRELMRADDLRAQVCVSMRVQMKVVALLLAGEQDPEEYVCRMEDWRTWGDAMCLSFIPDLISRPIQVYALNREKDCVFDSGMHLPKDASLHTAPVIVLWYNGKSHYDLVNTYWLASWERALCNSDKILSDPASGHTS